MSSCSMSTDTPPATGRSPSPIDWSDGQIEEQTAVARTLEDHGSRHRHGDPGAQGLFAVYVVLRVLVIAVAVLKFFNGDYEAVFLCILTLLLLLAPAFVQVRFRIELPSALEVIVLVFVFAAEILGEISSFYEIFPFWDTVLHTMNGFLAAAIGFSLVDLLNRSDRVKFELSPLYLAIVSFCFSMTIGVVWEFFEFSMDMMFGFDMQKDAVVHSISSVMLDPAHANHAIHINDITQVAVNGRDLGLGGYLDIGLIDTMEDFSSSISSARSCSPSSGSSM